MAVTKEQWQKAFDLLSRFERKLIGPELFKWDYFVNQVGASKPTLWRNQEFMSEFKRIQGLVKKYKNKDIEYSLERSQISEKDHQIEKLKKRIEELVIERDRAREQVAYAAMIARRRNIDPEEFTDRSPLLKANVRKPKKDVLDLDDPEITALRKKR